MPVCLDSKSTDGGSMREVTPTLAARGIDFLRPQYTPINSRVHNLRASAIHRAVCGVSHPGIVECDRVNSIVQVEVVERNRIPSVSGYVRVSMIATATLRSESHSRYNRQYDRTTGVIWECRSSTSPSYGVEVLSYNRIVHISTFRLQVSCTTKIQFPHSNLAQYVKNYQITISSL